MIKSLHKNDTLTTPFFATKNWQLTNVEDDNLVLMEHSGSTVALEFIDCDVDATASIDNSLCSICLEQQDDDLIRYREGQKSSGIFYETLEEVNLDGTYKRIVYSQIKEMFYNNHRDPVKMWGMEYLDFDKSQTKKFLSDHFRLYEIPRFVFGEKVVENTVRIYDTTTDNDYTIQDDGRGNLFATRNLFSKQQEVGEFNDNIFSTGSISICNSYFGITESVDTPPVEGYVMWLHPQSGFYTDEAGTTLATSNNDLVRRWNDDSGYDNHVTSSAARAPYFSQSLANGYNGLYFGMNGTNKTGLSSANINSTGSGLTVFVVAARVSTSDQYDTMFSYDPPDISLRNNNQLEKLQLFHNSSAAAANGNTVWGEGQLYVFGGRVSNPGNSLTAYLNDGTEATAVDAGNINTNREVTIGFRGDDINFSFWHGPIMEVLLYNGPLSDSDVLEVQEWLMNKYGL